jgi:hypothetical protein
VPLNLYLGANSDLLATLLRQASHQVTRPADCGLQGADDEDHFAYAVLNNLAIITKNPSDFKGLHDSDPIHGGIFAIYQDNDPARDMSDAEIVKSLANVELASQNGGDTIENHFHVLNDWRY